MEGGLEELWEQAQAALADSERLLSIGSPPATINRAYYAASALLLLRGRSPKSHRGVVDLLHSEFVRTGRMDRDLVRHYSRLYELRLWGDYGPFKRATPEAAAKAVEFARGFLARAEQLLGDRLGSQPPPA